jgi:hypothetical protein
MMPIMLIILGVFIAAVLLLIIAQGSKQRDAALSNKSVDWLVDDDTVRRAGDTLRKAASVYSVSDDDDDEKPKHAPLVQLTAGIRDMLDEGRKAEAIEIYQKFAGVDQYTAKSAVEQIEREMRLGDTLDEGDGYVDDETFDSGKLSG